MLDRMAFHGGSIQRVGAFGELRAEGVVEHPFPGIELEGELDFAVIEVDEAAVVAQANVLDADQRGLSGPACAGGVLPDRPACRHRGHWPARRRPLRRPR